MPADSASAAGERFAHDMRRIREARDVTRDDIHEEKRIAITLITAFERDGLFEHPAFNRVYLRSFVRAYSDCIDIDPELALSHLERALKGEYQNELAAAVLDATPSMGGLSAEPVDESGENAPDDDEEVDSRTSFGRPLSRQEREPQRFSPRPIGSAAEEPPGESTSPVRKSEERRHSDAAGEAATDSDEEAPPETSTEASAREKSRDTEAQEEYDPETGAEELETNEEGTQEAEAQDGEKEGVATAEDNDTPPRRADEEAESGASDASSVDTGATHIADSSVGTTEQAQLNTGAVFGKRPISSKPSGESDTEKAPDEKAPDEEEDSDGEGQGSAETTTGAAEAAVPASEGADRESDDVDREEDEAAPPVRAASDRSDRHPATDSPDEREDDAGDRTPDGEQSPKASPADRFRAASSADTDGPPPPAHGEMIGEPRPVGLSGDTASSDTSPSGTESPSSVEPPMAARAERERAKRDIRATASLSDTSTLLIGAGILVGAIVIGAVIWFLVSGDGDSPEPVAQRAETTSTQPASEPDTTASADGAEPAVAAEPPPANLVLGDTLQLVVQANTDISGIRIQRDSDLRRPYWINEGETMAFPFTERVIVWTQIDSVDLYLEDYRYLESEHVDDEGKVVITRDSARAFANTVRGPAATLPEPTVKPLMTPAPDITTPANN